MNMPPALTKVLWSLAIPAATVTGYIAALLAVAATGIDPVAATLIVSVIAAAVILVLRARKRSLFEDDPPQPSGLSSTLLAVFVLATVSGQVLSTTLRGLIGDEGFTASTEAMTAAGVIPALALVLIVAPVFEEVMLRGLIQPLLRRRIGLIATSIIVTSVFAGLHGNLVQATAILPLSVLLCWVYDRTRSLITPIAMHIGFNLIAMILPVAVVAAISTPIMAIMLLGIFALSFYQLTRSQPLLPAPHSDQNRS